jgi:tRNA (guanine37-N1)-methyltransferase
MARPKGVPRPLLSGHHAQIAAWRRQQSLALTVEKRPDLIEKARQSRLADPSEQFLKTDLSA